MTPPDLPSDDGTANGVSDLDTSTATRNRWGSFFVSTTLVIAGTALFVVSGFAIFAGESGVAQPVATVLGGAGVLGAGVLTFRSAHNARISAENTARDALRHAQGVAADEKERSEKHFSEQRKQDEITRAEQVKASERTHRREVIRDLRSRYTTCAEQLAHPSAAIRLAGVYALASLADDWQQQDEREEKQVAIDLLRAYLRTPNIARQSEEDGPYEYDGGELEVRKTITLTMHKHWIEDPSFPKSWKDFDCNMVGADLAHVDLGGANLAGANLTRANLAGANLSSANLAGANLSSANLAGADLLVTNLSRANLSRANLSRAKFFGTNLAHSNLSHANLTFTNLTLADLTRADLSLAKMTEAELLDTQLTQVTYGKGTRWPEGFTPPPSFK